MEFLKTSYSHTKNFQTTTFTMPDKEEMTVVHRLVKTPTLSEKIEVRRMQLVTNAANEKLHKCPETLPQEEMKLLSMLAGQWELCGADSADSGSDRCRINGTERYDWVPGGHFLSGDWNMLFGAETSKGVCIMGYHAVKKHLYLTNFDDAGYVRHYKVKVCGNDWQITGNRERINIHFASDNQSYTERREISTDNETWKLHCTIEAVKV
ncbi:hypothetical protein FNO01nite_29290 [Flavobacterium noncentrifugens]|uniref:DUF1579 domain-containing protein n=1 Tax=Flavobacterium noncentrifugens TaxID=1128970 RepID=A0A1G8Y035_9FLAO|nr:DUF1579 family protein [Flavobacterium noncentrifugens]GEP52257.1 hypothetical protein FNO01nite_29290 [Flavobacterium noncentrifugens]SDJ96132.1 Protein of unknown function [Flavobacterium noncentrifugens]